MFQIERLREAFSLFSLPITCVSPTAESCPHLCLSVCVHTYKPSSLWRHTAHSAVHLCYVKEPRLETSN